MGFPTANIKVPSGIQLPQDGVYAGLGLVGRTVWPAAINVGIPPMFAGCAGSAMLEANLIGFTGQIYGEACAIAFDRRLRASQEFASRDDLIAAVLGNIDDVRQQFWRERGGAWPMISDEDRERVRAATDLVALVQETVPLQPRNKEFWGCCPFHGEKTPSFHIIPATQVWHCFGCGEGGDCFSYVMKRENLSFPESIRYLADRAGIEIHDDFEGRQRGSKRSRLIEVCEASSQFFHTMLMRGRDDRPRTYFASRHMGGAVCKRYRLGFAPGRGSLVRHLTSLGFTPQEMVDANVAIRRDRGAVADRFYDRVMFPIFDELGRCIAFGGRIMGDGQPKYLNTSETALFHKKRNLYGFNWAKDDIVARAEAIVVEGYTDAIACWGGGHQKRGGHAGDGAHRAPRQDAHAFREAHRLPVRRRCRRAEGGRARHSVHRERRDRPALRGPAGGYGPYGVHHGRGRRGPASSYRGRRAPDGFRVP